VALLASVGSARAGEDPAPPPAPVTQPPDAAEPPPGVVGQAPDEAAQRLLAAALERFRLRDYPAALELLDRVYALAPNPGVLYNLGAVHAALGHCDEARAAYRRYITDTRSEAGRADAQRQLDSLQACEASPTAAASVVSPLPSAPLATAPSAAVGSLDSGAAPSVPSTDGAATSSVAAPPPAVAGASSSEVPTVAAEGPIVASPGSFGASRGEAPSGASVQRVAGWVAIASGGAMLVTSLSFAYASARANASDRSSDPGASGDAVADSQASGSRHNALAWGFGGGALALGSAGILLLLFEPEPESKTSIVVSPQGASAAWGVTVARRF
jgi:hypothetical protein